VLKGCELFCYTDDKKVMIKFYQNIANDVEIDLPEEEKKEDSDPLVLHLKIGMRYSRELFFTNEGERSSWHSYLLDA
jgi:hypothetical protein